MATQSVSKRVSSSNLDSSAMGNSNSGIDRIASLLAGPVARVALGLPMVLFGVHHFMEPGGMAFLVPSWLPGGVFWVVLTGVALAAAGVSFIINKLTRWAGWGLALLMVAFIVTVHIPGLGNEASAQFATISIFKDFAIAGGALLMTARPRANA